MKIAAYCRVSTDKEDQLNSLEAQKQFFIDYSNRTGDDLVMLYADEGLSGTKVKNRKQFLRMMADAELGLFDMLVVKDISRFARNTVDFLQNIRHLRALGIETRFLTANMTNLGNSEFVLTLFGALAQEESANTSKRVKFGKKINAEKGRVPNIVYGYDKTIGEYFNMTINKEEARVIRQIFQWYLKDGLGAAKIANKLNEYGSKTKRGCKWTQNAICRILENELYTGKIINGKEEITDFLTGKRVTKSREEWYILDRPELRIIDDRDFEEAQRLKSERRKKFKTSRERHSNLHLFSTLIKCKNCNRSFRQSIRTYKKTYVRWVCSEHNGKGKDNCPNAISVDENELIEIIENHFSEILSVKKNLIADIVCEFKKTHMRDNKNATYKKEIQNEIGKLIRNREKYINMYTDDLITREELNKKIGGISEDMDRLERELILKENDTVNDDLLEALIGEAFNKIEDMIYLKNMTNTQLRKVIEKIEIDSEGNVEIFLRHFKEKRIVDIVPYCNDRT